MDQVDTVADFVEMYDESLGAVGVSRLTPEQRDVLGGMLTAFAERRRRSLVVKILRCLRRPPGGRQKRVSSDG